MQLVKFRLPFPPVCLPVTIGVIVVGFCPDTGTGGDAYHFPSAFSGLICCGLSGNQDFPPAGGGMEPEHKIRVMMTHAGRQKRETNGLRKEKGKLPFPDRNLTSNELMNSMKGSEEEYSTSENHAHNSVILWIL